VVSWVVQLSRVRLIPILASDRARALVRRWVDHGLVRWFVCVSRVRVSVSGVVSRVSP
jgi:hypothetical protein